jgi:hypothetical protein
MKKKISNANRNFGILFFIVFLVIAFWSFRGNFYQIKILPLCISIIFLVLGLLNSKILSPLNKIWIKFGEIIGMIISPIVMFFIYFAFVTPIAIILRLFGKDLLKTKFTKSKSYWINREKNIGSMKKQF